MNLAEHPGDDAAGATGEATRSPPVLGLLEVLDRDGLARQALSVRRWPIRIGRALDNDLVLGDPHVAAHHATIDPVPRGLALAVAETRNGALLGRRRLRRGERAELAPEGEPIDLMLGRTHLRLRLPGHALAPELPTVPDGSPWRRTAPVAAAALVLALGTLFGTWLGTDPVGDGRALGTALLSLLVGGAAWCAVWALLTKTFTRQARFGWHLRVFLFGSVALMAVGALLPLLAFALSLPWLSAFDFVGVIGVVAAALYFHLLAIEPSRRRALGGAAFACAVVGVLLSMWFDQQRNEQFGDELYMSHLFPPSWRLARPVGTDAFVDGLAALRPTLDRKAREADATDDAPRTDDQ